MRLFELSCSSGQDSLVARPVTTADLSLIVQALGAGYSVEMVTLELPDHYIVRTIARLTSAIGAYE